ncbi:hypothetical protein [Conchiformibius steedae]|uniref:Uncharacterized protein n=1 Tax=Conchiformibius steedae TaxID=153493 RepID=A0A3P2AB69_9NEIS|nr:hypothetical protein [Conchiformibius steedae]RRD91460.1 hypothetical protein EII21_00025 [Conchiformibius steedae]
MPLNTGNTVSAVHIGAVGVAGTFFGMPLQALILGAFAGAVINGRNKASGRRQVLSSVLASMVLAGAFTPVVVLALLHFLPFGKAAQQPLDVAVPVLIGGCWSWAAPLIGDAVKRLLASWLGNHNGGNQDG